jgi:hypothetical protein
MKKIVLAASAAIISVGFMAGFTAANAASDDGLTAAIKGLNLDKPFSQSGGAATPLDILLRNQRRGGVDGGPTGSVGNGAPAVDGTVQPLPEAIGGVYR